MNKKTKRIGKRAGSALVAIGLCSAMMVSSIPAFALTPIADEDKMVNSGGKFYSSYSSNEELREETRKTNVEVVSEGIMLLKNGGGQYTPAQGGAPEDHSEHKLPYKDMKNISLFGINSDAYAYGGTGSGSSQIDPNGQADIYSSLEREGININPKLKALYQKYSGGSKSAESRYTQPTYDDPELSLDYYTPSIQATYGKYSDAALIVIGRLGGEGADLPTHNVSGHSNKEEHYLQLTDKEKALIKHVEDNFDKVVVLYNAGNVFELKELENDPRIDAVINIVQTGDYGFDGVLKVLKGEVSPSGRTTDFYATDFTLDPTYQNALDGSQVHPNGNGGWSAHYTYTNGNQISDGTVTGGNHQEVEYEEGIYLGYKYYETMYYQIATGKIDPNSEAAAAVLSSTDIDPTGAGFAKTGTNLEKANAWWDAAVAYPFGYGLSYTTFSKELKSLTLENGDAITAANVTETSTFKATITVTNTGDVAGKDVAELYLNAPFKDVATAHGALERSAVQLVGFNKTKLLAPGASEDVEITFSAYDIAAYDWLGVSGSDHYQGFKLEDGQYNFIAADNSHDAVKSLLENSATKVKNFSLNSNVNVKHHPATGVEIKPTLVNNKDSKYYNYSSVSPTMTIMSRTDMIGTFPQAITDDELDLSKNSEAINPIVADHEEYQITKKEIALKLGWGFRLGKDDETGELWTKDIPENWNKTGTVDWTQAADDKGEVTIWYTDLMGLSPYSDEVIEEGDTPNATLVGKTQAEAWALFVNQLTYAELMNLQSNGFFKTYEIARVGKMESCDADGPATIGNQTKNGYQSQRGYGNTRYWAACMLQASTWNLELLNHVGTLIGEEGMWNGYNGWYAPGADTHRSAFAGRCFEYYSQDGMQGALVAGAIIKGATSKGIVTYFKHIVLNDQETARISICTWADEQTTREIYLRQFEGGFIAGGSTGAMAGFNRVGTVDNAEHYPLQRQIYRGEWGFVGDIVTDWQRGTVGANCANLEVMTRAGCNLPLWDKATKDQSQSTWDAEKGCVTFQNIGYDVTTGEGESATKTHVDLTDAQIATSAKVQWYYTRISAMETLYIVNCGSAMDNGADYFRNLPKQDITLYAGIAGSAKLNVNFDDKADIAIKVLESNLPDGVTFNANTLTFNATNRTVADTTGTIKLQANYDGWAASDPVTVTVKIVKPIDFSGAAKTELNAAYAGTVSQSAWTLLPEADRNNNNIEGVTSITLNDANGLPEGLTLNKETGVVSGTPTKAGVYNVEFSYQVAGRQLQWWGSWSWMNNYNNTYKATYQIVVGDIYTVTIGDNTVQVVSGDKVTAPEAPVAPNGKVFDGWYIKDTDTKFDFDTAITENITLEAKYSNALQFRVNDGSLEYSVDGIAWNNITAGSANISISETTGTWIIDNVDTGIKAQGPEGPKGTDGKDGAQGPAGPAGADGSGCGSVIGATSAALVAFAVVLGGVAVARIARRKEND